MTYNLDANHNYDSYLDFSILGKIKPYVRMTQRGKWVNDQAKEYLASKEAIAWVMRNHMGALELKPLPPRTSLSAVIIFYVPERVHTCDLDNQVKAILDAAQGIAFSNDAWFDEIIARREAGPEHHTTVSFSVRER